MAGSVWAIVVAAGKGTRFGGPKQFALVGGRTVVELAIATVAPATAGIVVVIPPDLVPEEPGRAEDLLATLGVGRAGVVRNEQVPELRVVAGRESRAGSVRAGLAAVPAECEVVVVHDAARPLASSRMCQQVVDAVRAGADGAVPGISLTDTVKRTSGGQVVETLSRDALVRVQTPQAFRASVLRQAHAGDPEATDDAGLVEALGGLVIVVPGEETNLKITSRGDLELIEWWYERLGGVGAGDLTTVVEPSR
ncbi:MAG: 2-C-methyl-D-erythritol 4-phosphate cytidylyltransferase [Acidimicrobiales bacterium]